MRLLFAVPFLVSACATAPPPSTPAAYFDPEAFRPSQFLPGPPASDSPLGGADLATVRALVADSPRERRTLAIADAELDLSLRFEAALGQRVNPDAVPLMVTLFTRAFVDGARIFLETKAPFARVRPLVADPSIDFCWPEHRAAYSRDFSYPSGHSAWGWASALMLAEMVPEREEALLARGREIGDSRVVCGVHYPSDVEAGRLVAAAYVARLRASPAYQRDFEAARRELRTALGLPN